MRNRVPVSPEIEALFGHTFTIEKLHGAMYQMLHLMDNARDGRQLEYLELVPPEIEKQDPLSAFIGIKRVPINSSPARSVDIGVNKTVGTPVFAIESFVKGLLSNRHFNYLQDTALNFKGS